MAAAPLILVSAERARDFPQKSVYLLGTGASVEKLRWSIPSSFLRKQESRSPEFQQLPPVQARGKLWTPAFAGATK